MWLKNQSISSNFEKYKFTIHIYVLSLLTIINLIINSLNTLANRFRETSRDKNTEDVKRRAFFPLARRQLTALRATYYPRHTNHSLLAFARRGRNNSAHKKKREAGEYGQVVRYGSTYPLLEVETSGLDRTHGPHLHTIALAFDLAFTPAACIHPLPLLPSFFFLPPSLSLLMAGNAHANSLYI